MGGVRPMRPFDFDLDEIPVLNGGFAFVNRPYLPTRLRPRNDQGYCTRVPDDSLRPVKVGLLDVEISDRGFVEVYADDCWSTFSPGGKPELSNQGLVRAHGRHDFERKVLCPKLGENPLDRLVSSSRSFLVYDRSSD